MSGFPRILLSFATFYALLQIVATAWAAEVLPSKPARYFNDYASVTPVPLQQQLDRELEALEKSDGSQIVVAVYPRMQSDSSIEDYTVRLAESWKVGQKEKNNGAVLFVFVQDRKMYIQVGYGLEGAIPDATAKDITEFRIKPHFRNGDYATGLSTGVRSLIQAAKGEYKGTGRTVANQRRSQQQAFPFVVWVVLFLAILAIGSTRRRRGYMYGGRGRRSIGPVIWGGPSWGSSGGGSRGGGGWSGGFSGGGGSFGGGGAGSSW